MKKTIWIIGLDLALSGAFSPGAWAKQYISTPKNWQGQLEKFTGKIEKVDLANKEITLSQGRRK